MDSSGGECAPQALADGVHVDVEQLDRQALGQSDRLILVACLREAKTHAMAHDVGSSVDSLVGVFGLTASYPLLLVRLTSKLADVLVVGVAGFEPTTSSSRTKRATKLRHTPCAAGDSIASTHRGEEIGAAESCVT